MAVADKLVKASSLKIVYDYLSEKVKKATPEDYEQVKKQVNKNKDDIANFAGDVVSISDQNPTSEFNRFWVKRNKRQIEVPEMREFNELSNTVGTKVDKVSGKALSTNDYTNEAKAKVDAIPADPKYTDTIYDDTEIVKDVGELRDDLTDVEKRLKSGKIEDAELHLGFYLDDNGDLCQED